MLSQVMAQQFGIVGCEAALDCFHRTELADKCTSTHKHALYLYYGLKQLSRQFGHTFVRCNALEREASAVRSIYQPSSKARDGVIPSQHDWSQALDFLEDWRVIVRENDGTDIYLHRYWNAEKTIADAFHVLRKRHETDPWIFEIDAEK